MKKVLFLPTFNFNNWGGGAQATRAFLDSILEIFGKENVDVFIGCEYKLLEEYKSINAIKIPKRSWVKGLYEIIKGVIVRWTIPLQRYLNQHYKEYDLVILNSSRSGTIVPSIKKLGLKVVTIHHNEEIEYCMDNKSIYTLGGLCRYFINNTQEKAYKNSDVNLFLTVQDKEKFELMYGKCSSQINDIIGVYDYKSAKIISHFNSSINYNIGISGSLVTFQTIHGITDIMRNYFDIIKDLIPNCKILLTGREPSPEIIKIANDYISNVDIIANPEDIISVIQDCAIYLCPTNIGGGLKLRAMDGLKSGLPILAHKISARGYDMLVGKPYFKVYDNKKSFRKGLIELLEFVENIDIETRKHISKEYYSYFGYVAGTKRLKKILLH